MKFLKIFRKYLRRKKSYNLTFFRHLSYLKQFKNSSTSARIDSLSLKHSYFVKLIDEYLYRQKKFLQTMSDDHWDPIFNNFQLDIKQVLVSNDKKKILELLDNPGKTNLFVGFETNTVSKMWQRKDNDILAADKLFSFAEFLGVEKLYNPEREKLSIKKINLDNILEKIEKKIGIKLAFKNPFPGTKGIITSRGILNEKEIQAIYTAYEISKIIKKGDSVLEIGGGLGRVAYYCERFGINDYTIVDIPISFLASGNYLARVLKCEKIKFERELNRKYSTNAIKLCSPEFLYKNNIDYKLVVNCDSLTEINLNIAKKYISKILKSKYFLSINHESNKFTVNSLIKNNKFINYERNLYWLRKGYIKEFYQFY
jgi:hypothetical protein